MPAAYLALVDEFLNSSTGDITSTLAANIHELGFQQLRTAQLPSWQWEIEVLKQQLSVFHALRPNLKIAVALEFSIPRCQRRIDAVLLIDNFIVVLEFKSGTLTRAAIKQAEDYAMNLSDFHKPSRGLWIVPIVVSSHSSSKIDRLLAGMAPVFRGSEIGSKSPAGALDRIAERLTDRDAAPISPDAWKLE